MKTYDAKFADWAMKLAIYQIKDIQKDIEAGTDTMEDLDYSLEELERLIVDINDRLQAIIDLGDAS